MKVEDSGLICKTKLKEARIYIRNIEKLGFDVSKEKKDIEEIENDIDKKINRNSEKYDYNTLGVETLLMLDYTTASQKIDEVISGLKNKWSSYIEIDDKCNKIINSLKDVNESNIDEIVSDTIELIDMLRHSTTIDYDLEKELVDKTYKTVYEVLQLESIYSSNQVLRDKVSSNSIDSPHIYELLIADLKKINNDECKDICDQLKGLPLNVSKLIDGRLLFLVALYNNPENIDKQKDRFLVLADECLFHMLQLDNLKYSQQRYENIINRTHKKIKNAKKSFALKSAGFIVSGTIIAGIMALCVKDALNNKEKYPVYDQITTTYDSKTGDIEVTNSIGSDTDQYAEITKYSALEPTKFGYRRTETYYKVTGDDIDYDCDYDEFISKYVKKEYKELGKLERYYSTNESPDHKEDSYTIIKHTVDFNSSTEERESKNAITVGIITGIISSVMFILLEGLTFSILLNKATEDDFVGVKKYKILKQDYKTYCDNYSIEQKEILDKINNEEIAKLKSMRDALCLYEKLDDSVKDSKEVKKAYKKIKQFL